MVQTHNHDVSLLEVPSQNIFKSLQQWSYMQRLGINLAVFNSGKSTGRSISGINNAIAEVMS